MDKSGNDRRIDYIEIPVTDIERAKGFYGAVFGWPFQDWGNEYSSFNDGRLDGGLMKVDTVTPGGVLVIMYANDLEETLERVKSAGGKIKQPIFGFPGGRRFHFTDPDGHELGVWSETRE